MPPRAVVMKIAPFFMRAKVSAFIIFSVLASRGQCSDTKSDCASSSSNDTGLAPRRSISSVDRKGSVAITSMPNARASAATRLPMCPMPTRPTV